MIKKIMLPLRSSKWKSIDYERLPPTLLSIQVLMLLSLTLMNVIDPSQVVHKHQWRELLRLSTHLRKVQAVEGGSLPLKGPELKLLAELGCLLICRTEVRIFHNLNRSLCIKSWLSQTKEWNLQKPDRVLLENLQCNNLPSTNQQDPHQLKKQSNTYLILMSR